MIFGRFAAIVAAALSVTTASAQSLESFRFQVDNDWFDFWQRSVDRPDDNYTAGHAARVVLDWAPKWGVLAKEDCAAARRTQTPISACVESVFALTQEMYTPTNDSPAPEVGQRPYAGILTAELGLQRASPKSLSVIEAIIGTTGKNSGAEWAQKLFHRLADLRKPLGWEHQIAGEPVVGMKYAASYLLTPAKVGRRSAVTAVSTVSGTLTNVRTGANAGLELHAGHNAPHPWMPTSVIDRRRIRAYLIAGANETWVARNILIDGNTPETRGLVTREMFIFESVWGGTIGRDGVFIEYRATSRTPDYNTAPRWKRYGTLSLIIGTP